MGVTAAIISAATAIGSTAYSISAANKAEKKSASVTQDLLSSRPDLATQQAAAQHEAASASAAQQKKTRSSQGYSSTLLTSGAVPSSAPVALKTLLGQ